MSGTCCASFLLHYCPPLSPPTCCVSCSSHTPFCSCFVQLALRAQTDTKHERQCAPHDGSLATVCGNSRGGGIVHIWRFLKQKMPLILLSDISYLTSSSSSLQTVLESVYPSELPPMMKSFFLCYGDETPGSMEPLGEHASCFEGGSSECLAQGNSESLAGAC